MRIPVVMEVAGKKSFATAVEWPGWSRSGRSPDAALEALAAYQERYAPVAAEAGIRWPARFEYEVIERIDGSSGTEFGIPYAVADDDRRRLTKPQAARLAALVDAAWTLFDAVATASPATLRKGPRGGGRDRDKMVGHVLEAEVPYARKLGLKLPPPVDDDAIAANRAAVLDALRQGDALELPDKGWPPRYAARRIAWHVLDHAWEMQDRST